MSAPTLDLTACMAARDREIRAGRTVVAERIGDLADKVLAWANRADRARARLAPDDAEAAHSVERWCVRRLRGERLHSVAGGTDGMRRAAHQVARVHPVRGAPILCMLESAWDGVGDDSDRWWS